MIFDKGIAGINFTKVDRRTKHLAIATNLPGGRQVSQIVIKFL
ncbi:MAG: hypothetical protein Q8M94_20360 [Ignavibacteria bacterium]|nr:hypothetical protein [Ignavibacteria bacterium]